MNILLAGKDSSDSSTKDDNFSNVKKEEVFGKLESFFCLFDIFLVAKNSFRSNVSNQRIKVDVLQIVSSLMMDFITRLHFTAL